jgi:S-adenosylmethionine decarboxylase
MLEAITIAKVSIISENFHEFSPQGVTGVILLQESHFSVHTWPEFSYAALDLFTCGQDLEMTPTYTYLKNKFRAKRMSIFRVERGVMSEIKFDGD